MKKTPTEEYVEKAKLLTEEETERLLSRMRAKLLRRLEDKKLTVPEVVAMQLEIEDEELNEWREKMAEIRKKSKGKESKA
jgi:2-oxoglutarate dehydrogenase complex dehydrogenase (E1) component-like enzyme